MVNRETVKALREVDVVRETIRIDISKNILWRVHCDGKQRKILAASIEEDPVHGYLLVLSVEED